MFRLTMTPTEAVAPSVGKTRIRVYRWDNMWGTLEGDTWTSEIRKPVQHSSTFLLEEIRMKYELPPVVVDDMWEEDIVRVGNMTYGGTTTMVGSLEEIRAAFPSLSLSLSLSLTPSSASTHTSQKQPPQLSPCQTQPLPSLPPLPPPPYRQQPPRPPPPPPPYRQQPPRPPLPYRQHPRQQQPRHSGPMFVED